MKEGFIQKSDERKYTLGIVYEPDVVDSQGDFAKADEIEKAAWKFMKRLQCQAKLTKSVVGVFKQFVEGVKKGDANIDITDVLDAIKKEDASGLGFQHATWNSEENEIGDIVESYIAPCDMTLGDQVITKGTWMMGVVWNDTYWAKVQKGEMTGYSMGGTGKRIDTPEN